MRRNHFKKFAEENAKAIADIEDVESIKTQNNQLLEETSTLLRELTQLQRNLISKQGYLYKWRSKQIGFGAHKWKRYFFRLDGSNLSFYESSHSASPWRTIPLKRCVVRSEPPKKGGQYHVFAIYNRSANGVAEEDDSEDEHLIIRLSTESEADAKEWIHAISEGCLIDLISRGGEVPSVQTPISEIRR